MGISKVILRVVGLTENNKIKDLNRAQTFDAINGSETVESALHVIKENYPVEHVTYHLGQAATLDGKLDAPFVKTTYPAEWIARYLMKDYVKIDPILNEGLERSLPFDWASITPDERAIELLMDFQAHGLGANGYSIPLTDKVGRRALFSLNSAPEVQDWNAIVRANQEDWIELGQLLHKKAIREIFGDVDPIPALSPREIETLLWVARGKDHKAIGIILGVSEHTVRVYMRTARLKLDCSSMSQAVAKAGKYRLINP